MVLGTKYCSLNFHIIHLLLAMVKQQYVPM
jgi:hypothetical protein